jgi:hypothetical protein
MQLIARRILHGYYANMNLQSITMPFLAAELWLNVVMPYDYDCAIILSPDVVATWKEAIKLPINNPDLANHMKELCKYL